MNILASIKNFDQVNLITYKVDHLLMGNNNVNQEHVLALPRFVISRPTEPIPTPICTK
jgi:hypothetical protein